MNTGYASPPSSVENDIDDPSEPLILPNTVEESEGTVSEHSDQEDISQNEQVQTQPTAEPKRGRGRPRKYPVGTTNYDALKARRIVDPNAVISVKEYSFRSRREKRSLSPDYTESGLPVRGMLRAQLEQDLEFSMMPGRSGTGLSSLQAAPKPPSEPYDGPKRSRGRPKKIVLAEETLTLD
jgi:hypothetical protein